MSPTRPGPFRAHRSRTALSRPCCAEPLESRTLLADGPASLLKDVNTNTASSVPTDIVPLGGLTLFRADDGVHGNEWFRTDGTAAGTSLLKDVNPGVGGSRPTGGSPSPREPTAATVGATLFFSAIDPTRGAELWKTDGTPGGTVLVKDIRPGPASSSPSVLTAVGNTLYFVANDGTNGVELWKSDGTEAGTIMVADLALGSATAGPVPIGVLNNRLFFAAQAPDGGVAAAGLELWVTDGTAAGTTLVKNINPTGGSDPGVNWPPTSTPPRLLTVVSGGALYFAATHPAYGRELWKTDGTPDGTVLVADVTPGATHTAPVDLTVTMPTVNGARLESVYFTGRHPDGFNSAVYRTRPGGGAEIVQSLSSRGGLTTGMGNGGFFVLAEPYWGVPGLYVHYPHFPSGTPMRLVKELPALPPVEGTFAGGGSHIFFLAPGEAPNTVALWRTDGWTTPTLVATHPASGANAADINARWTLGTGGNGIYYAANDHRYGTELHRVSLDGAGSSRVIDLNQDTVSAVEGGTGFVTGPAGGRALFVADDGVHGREVWATDGTKAGTFLLKDITPGPGHGIRTLAHLFSPDVNGLVYFEANSSGTRPDEGKSAWVTDGTPEGTRPVAVGGGSVFEFRDRPHFVGRDGLFTTDGTAAGTTQIVTLDTGLAVRHSVVVGDTVYLFSVRSVDGEIVGSELWKTDGTQAGTSHVRSLAPGDVIADGPPAAALGDDLYLITQTRTGPKLLWRTDGTNAGTSVVRELPVFQGTLTQMVAAGDRVFFEAGVEGASDISRTAVWVADADGARPVSEVAPPLAEMTNVTGLTSAGGVAFFFAQPPGRSSSELWRTDGTAAGTARLKPPATETRALGVADGVFYFRAADAATGVELWRSDGTEAGTYLVQDVRPGPGGSNPGGLYAFGDRIYFVADDGTHGREMWSMPRAAAATTVAGRHVFYNNSAFDGRDPAATAADLAAIAPDKSALLPGQAATFANVTSYDKGINGILVDFSGKPDEALGADDFEFHAGRTADPAAWTPAPAPASVVLLPSPLGAAVTRYAITWADDSLVNTWLRVTVKANERTGLAAPDVFYFGNLVGETGAEGPTGVGPGGGGGARLLVTARDLVSLRRRQVADVSMGSPFDINRDRSLDVRDLILVRRNLFRSLPLIGSAPPVAAAAVAPRPAVRAAPPTRSVFSAIEVAAAGGDDELLA